MIEARIYRRGGGPLSTRKKSVNTMYGRAYCNIVSETIHTLQIRSTTPSTDPRLQLETGVLVTMPHSGSSNSSGIVPCYKRLCTDVANSNIFWCAQHLHGLSACHAHDNIMPCEGGIPRMSYTNLPRVTFAKQTRDIREAITRCCAQLTKDVTFGHICTCTCMDHLSQ
jgi:hypothetical protein